MLEVRRLLRGIRRGERNNAPRLYVVVDITGNPGRFNRAKAQ